MMNMRGKKFMQVWLIDGAAFKAKIVQHPTDFIILKS